MRPGSKVLDVEATTVEAAAADAMGLEAPVQRRWHQHVRGVTETSAKVANQFLHLLGRARLVEKKWQIDAPDHL